MISLCPGTDWQRGESAVRQADSPTPRTSELHIEPRSSRQDTDAY